MRADCRSREFDAVLVDAPCTNTGVLAQRPEARRRFTPQNKRELVALQTQLRARRRVRATRRSVGVVDLRASTPATRNRRAVDAFLADTRSGRSRSRPRRFPTAGRRRRAALARSTADILRACAGEPRRRRELEFGRMKRTTTSCTDHGRPSGIGAATARLLASEGYRVALLARRATHSNACARASRAATNIRARVRRARRRGGSRRDEARRRTIRRARLAGQQRRRRLSARLESDDSSCARCSRPTSSDC